MTQTLIVTGGAGFIGSNFIHMLVELRPSTVRIVNLDALTYAGNLENLTGLESHGGYTFVKGDVTSKEDVAVRFRALPGGDVSVVHFAAESHVDRSIQSGLPFVQANVLGTQVLLDTARARGRSALRARLDRRGLRVARQDRAVHRGDAPGAELSVLGEQGGQRHACPGCVQDPRLPRR